MVATVLLDRRTGAFRRPPVRFSRCLFVGCLPPLSRISPYRHLLFCPSEPMSFSLPPLQLTGCTSFLEKVQVGVRHIENFLGYGASLNGFAPPDYSIWEGAFSSLFQLLCLGSLADLTTSIPTRRVVSPPHWGCHASSLFYIHSGDGRGWPPSCW